MPRKDQTLKPNRMIIRQGYKTSTRTKRHRKSGNTETEHWSGRQDAHVHPKPVRYRVSPQKGRGR